MISEHEASPRTALLFQGQTFDFRKVFAKSKIVQAEVARMNQFCLGIDLVEICETRMDDLPNRAAFEHPANFCVAIASARAGEYSVNVFAGHSFGEYAALHLSGALPFRDALCLVRERGRVIAKANEREPGMMAAVMGRINLDVARQICRDTNIDIGNINSPEQIVISGKVRGVEEATSALQGEGLKTIPLHVGAAFHSRLLLDAQEELARYIEGVPISRPKRPLFMNQRKGFETEPRAIAGCLIGQVASPLDFSGAVESMLDDGIKEFKEVSAGSRKTLLGFIKKIRENIASRL